MSKTLIIAEKPSVAGEIAKALGGFTKSQNNYERDDIIVAPAVGHLIELSAPQSLLDSAKTMAALPLVPKPFVMSPIRDSASYYKNLNALMARSDVSSVVNACDAGREGELIFRLIYEHAKCRKTMKRMWLRTMTADGIREAFNAMEPGSNYDDLADAARSRAEADWIIGINGSRAMTHIFNQKSSQFEFVTMGRVQSPTLALVVKRELDIRNFVPKDYWEVHGKFALPTGRYTAKWHRQGAQEEGVDADSKTRFNVAAEAEAVAARTRGKTADRVVDESKQTKENAPALYDLTTLQREANRRFKIGAKKTLDIAQALYETHKATTYPRTDAQALPEDYVDTAVDVLGKLSGGTYGPHAQRVLDNGWCKPNPVIFNNEKISDHFAIIPTGIVPSGLSREEALVYDLICKRFIAVFHPAAEFLVTTRSTFIGSDLFKCSGKVCVSPGWQQVYAAEAKDEDAVEEGALCPYSPGDVAKAAEVAVVGLQTKPPVRFTEGTLLGAMETAGKLVDDDAMRQAMKERGLGTPATRANIIEGLFVSKTASGKPRKPYCQRTLQGKTEYIQPTDHGISLIKYAHESNWGDLVSPAMTGEWEMMLREVESGKRTRTDFMNGIVAQITRMVGVLKDAHASAEANEATTTLDVTCPSCSGEVIGTSRIIRCKTACGFEMRRVAYGRTFTDADFATLLANGKAGPFTFVSVKTNREYAGEVKLKPDWSLEMSFVDAPRPNTTGPAIGAPCPKCGGSVAITDGKWPAAMCAAACGFRMSMEIAKRKLKPQDIETLLKTRRLSSYHGYVSSAGKKFAASLELKPDFSGVSFVFEDR